MDGDTWGGLSETHTLKQTSLVYLKQSLRRYTYKSAHILKKKLGPEQKKITFCILMKRELYRLGVRASSGYKSALRVFRAQKEIQGLFG